MATTPVLGKIGTQVDLLIKQGSTFGPMVATLTNPDLTPVNLTACIIRGQIRKKALDATIVASFVVAITNEPGGVFEFGLTDEVTAIITADEIMQKPGSKYVWDMELEDSLGRVIPLYYGDVTVFREVTRP